MRNAWKSIFLLAIGILSACGGQQSKQIESAEDSTPQSSYLIELVSVDKFQRYAIAKFQIKMRSLETRAGQVAKWQPASNRPVELNHIGNHLKLSDDMNTELRTDSKGIFRIKIALADPLEFFRWVKPSSYPLSDEYVAKFGDVKRTTPYEYSGEWKGWRQTEVDENYLIKFRVDNAAYWLPISYKDIRPILKKISEDVHEKELSHLHLEFEQENHQKLEGIDVFISAPHIKAEVLLKKYIFSEEALNYAMSVFPPYVYGEDGGYDKSHFSLIPGNYKIRLQRSGKIIFEDLIAIHEPGKQKVNIFVEQP